ncbi:MAG TPA: hypothetical protein VG708_07160 [Mycobacteriales bacterium]|nr:hypothetical protein [Mycobacteriales bacterium]
MKAKPLPIKVGVGAAALAVALTACGSSSSGGANANSSSGPTSSASTGATDASASTAASLRAGLDELFREHVDLTGFVVQTAVQKGISSANTTQALNTLDKNTQALAAAVGSVYGASAQQQFLKMWRAHIGFFVTYTKGLATKDQSMVATAQHQLAGYKAQFSKFLGTATDIPASAIANELQGHIQTLEAAIRAIVASSPSAASKLQMAAMHMDGTAQALAAGIDQQKNLAGNADGDAASLRAALTGLLLQHVAQTAAVVQTAVGTSLSSPQTKAALSALDDNTVGLGKAIGSLYGGSAQQQFLKMWRAHIGFFVTYTAGLAGHDQAMVRQAQGQLANYKRDFARFLGPATGLPAAAVSKDLQGHITTLEAAIKAIVAGNPDAAARLSMAESHMAGTAAVLASAITKQQHLS